MYSQKYVLHNWQFPYLWSYKNKNKKRINERVPELLVARSLTFTVIKYDAVT
jgi:hypothetical protein